MGKYFRSSLFFSFLFLLFNFVISYSSKVQALVAMRNPMVPHEVFIMYKRQWESSVREGKNREEINRKGGKVSAADYLSKRNKIELCKNVVEMLPTTNVRILREVLGVVRVVCLLWRPWEIGRRSIRKGDNTLDNILPRFARMLITGEDINGERFNNCLLFLLFFYY